jgi:DNA-binding NtrC family response regulator
MDEKKPTIRLLLVDDESEFLEATARALARRGFAMNQAADGETALMILSRQEFDVVVLDVKMPGIDGLDVFRQIHSQFPDLPVVLLTGHGNIQQAFETAKEGVFEYLSKPCDVERIAEIARRAARRPRQTNEAVATGSDEKMRLLLVDDEVDLLDSLSSSLSRRGIKVTAADNARDAQRMVQQQVFDVALVDAKMPGIDGLGLLRRIKRLQPELEVIVLTGHPSMGLAVESLREGASDVLMKPQSPDVLAAKIRNAWQLQQHRREQQRNRAVRKILLDKPD